MYYVKLGREESFMVTTPPEPVILRYKDPVLSWALVPHVLFMFLAMVFSMRTGIVGLTNGAGV
jgi:hypothetical protein